MFWNRGVNISTRKYWRNCRYFTPFSTVVKKVRSNNFILRNLYPTVQFMWIMDMLFSYPSKIFSYLVLRISPLHWELIWIRLRKYCLRRVDSYTLILHWLLQHGKDSDLDFLSMANHHQITFVLNVSWLDVIFLILTFFDEEKETLLALATWEDWFSFCSINYEH